MKTVLLIALCSLSFLVHADRVIIQGQPIILETQDNQVYSVPSTYTPSDSYTYVSVNGIPRVCYLNPQPALATLDMITLNVEVQGTTTTWNCYAVDDTYFEVSP